VTLLHRGLSAPALFGDTVEHLIADRDATLPTLEPGRRWDVVVDTSGYFPRQIHAAGAWLHGRVGRFQFVSSISAYAEPQAPGGLDELQGSLAPWPEGEPEPTTITGANYGWLKAACESAAVQRFGADATLLVRPGLIVGPHDPTGRFDWWLRRLRLGGAILAPAADSSRVQWIDARDLAAWMLRQATAGTTGAFNLTGPTLADQPHDFRSWLEVLRACTTPQAEFAWVDGAWAQARGVAPWTDWPLWLPPGMDGLLRAPIERARASGLEARPLRETVADTLAWLDTARPAGSPANGPARPTPGLDASREAALLADWRAAGSVA
jgi:2'-hydroxyisoflavone reductase